MNASTVIDDQPRTAEERALQLAFLPLYKRAFGVAAGVTLGVAIFLATLIQLVRIGDGVPLALLGEYFYGYTVSLPGAFIGAGWGFVTGFVIGWFFAFCRNLAVATALFIARTRAELARMRDFLDHI